MLVRSSGAASVFVLAAAAIAIVLAADERAAFAQADGPEMAPTVSAERADERPTRAQAPSRGQVVLVLDEADHQGLDEIVSRSMAELSAAGYASGLSRCVPRLQPGCPLPPGFDEAALVVVVSLRQNDDLAATVELRVLDGIDVRWRRHLEAAPGDDPATVALHIVELARAILLRATQQAQDDEAVEEPAAEDDVPAPDRTSPPSFATLDRIDGRSLLGFDTGLTFLDGSNAQRFELYGQASRDLGSLRVGGYASASFAHQSGQPGRPIGDVFAYDVHGMGNLEGGVILVVQKLAVLRAGLVYPFTDTDGSAANVTAGVVRLTDVVRHARDGAWLRISTSPVLRIGRLFTRVDLGFDLCIRNCGAPEAFSVMRGNVGLGWQEGPLIFTGELVNVLTTEDNRALVDRLRHTAAASVRYTLRWVQPWLAFVQALDRDPRERTNAMLLAGVQLILP